MRTISEYYENMVDVIVKNAGNKKGVIFVGKNYEKRVLYQTVYQKARGILKHMQELGFQPGDEIIIQIDKNADFISSVWACILGGMPVVPLSTAVTPENVRMLTKVIGILDHPGMIISSQIRDDLESSVEETDVCVWERIENKIVIYEDMNDCAALSEHIYEPDKDEIAAILFSSGSTGEPKGVMQTHDNIVSAIGGAVRLHAITGSDVFLGWLPLTHIIGIHLFHFVPLAVGADQIIMDKSDFIQNPVKWMQLASAYQASFLVSPNFGYKHFLQYFKKEQAGSWNLSCIRLILNGAEPVSEVIADAFTNALSEFGLKRNAMCPSYGMTEATITISSYIASKKITSMKIDRVNLVIGNTVVETEKEHAPSFVSLGTVTDNLEVSIWDDNMQTLQNRTIGYIYIRGSSVAKGYYKNETATKQAYTGNGWFKTGDIGFFDDHQLYITGREKDMVILHGQNYYLNDIDRIAQEVVGVTKAAACLVPGRTTGEEEILLAVLWEDNLEHFFPMVVQIRSHLNVQIGILCRYIVPVAAIPCTASGKIQRFRLVEMYCRGAFTTIMKELESCFEVSTDKEGKKSSETILAETISPEMTQSDTIRSGMIQSETIQSTTILSKTERKLISLWFRVLKTENIKSKTSFFRLGGNSIQIMQLMQLIEDEFNCRISYNQFVLNSTPSKLADYIVSRKADQTLFAVQKRTMDKKNLYAPFPLTNLQLAYVLGRNKGMELGGVGTHHYEELSMNLDVDRFNQALQKVIQRHHTLRTLILENGTQQIMKDIPQYRIRVEDISHLSTKQKKKMVETQRHRMSHQVFEPGMWPYFEFKAFRLNPGVYYLFISIDLLILDAASLFYFSRELVKYYKNPDFVMPEINFTIRDYVIGLNEITESELYRNSRDYWLSKLEKIPQAPAIPLITNPTDVKKPHFTRKRKIFQSSAWSKLKWIAKKQNVTPSAILCTAYAEILSLWSSQKELALTLTLFGRYPFHEDVGAILGDFTSLIIVGLEMNSQESFWEKVRYVQNVTMDALEHRHYDGIELIREYAKYHNMAGRAAFPYVFSSILFDGESEGWDELGSSRMQLSQTSQVYLDNQLMDVEGQLSITWDYVEQIFAPELMDAMFDRYIALISSIILYEDCDNEILDQKYKLEYLVYNNSFMEQKSNTLHGLFARQVMQNETKTAIIEGEKSITYGELDKKSNQMASYLLERGIGENQMVGVMVERKINTIINILGILKAGGAYVPIDPNYPKERIKYILSNSKCSLILQTDTCEKNNIMAYDASDPCKHFPDRIAYVIYTSGSTGRPKGVIITHEAAVNTIQDINNKFGVCEKDRMIGVSSMCFDLSVYDIFGTLAAGAELVMISDQRDVYDLNRVVMQQKITIWNTVPAIMDMMLTYADQEKQNESLRLVMLSGDWIPLSLPDKIAKSFSNARVISLGGATEASIWSIYFPVKTVKESWKSIPYGYPLANQQIYILNYRKQLCPVGVPGEIHIGGKGVAKGYCNDEVRTAEFFFNHPQFGYLYRTGDYGVFHDGYVEFLGRKDNQVKIQGYRIEMGEIQNRLRKHPCVKNAVVTVFTDQQETKQLCAYVECMGKVSVLQLKNFLLKDLPAYMIPVSFVFVDKIPLTSNGKPDCKALPLPSHTQDKEKDDVLPRNDMERRLWECFRRVLNIDKISIKDNFFEIGGNSVKAIQLVNIMSRRFQVRINQVFESQTIEELAKRITWKEESLSEKVENLKQRHAQINDENYYKLLQESYQQYLSTVNRHPAKDLFVKENYENILLTGATGYLGSYLLKELLENTKYKIYVMIRGTTKDSARKRLADVVDGYLGEKYLEKYTGRVNVILADLTREYLGMTPKLYEEYATNIDCILHSAANVKHFGLRGDFEEVNVRGVERLAAFAGTGIKKDIHYISTNGLSMYETNDPAKNLYSEMVIDFGQTYDNYYLQTKFEAEKVLVKAREGGLQVNIYRVGVLVFDSATGKFQKNITENAFYNNLRSYMKLGMMPDTAFEKLEFSFVDYVSRAIALLFDRANLKNEVFHIYNHEKITPSEFALLLQESAMDITITSFDAFLDSLVKLQDDREVGVFVEDLLFAYQIYENMAYLPKIVSDKTVRILEQLDFQWDKPNAIHIGRMLEHCRQVEFI